MMCYHRTNYRGLLTIFQSSERREDLLMEDLNSYENLYLSKTPCAACITGPSGSRSRVKIHTDSKQKSVVKSNKFGDFFGSY